MTVIDEAASGWADARGTSSGEPGFWRRYGVRWSRSGKEIVAILALFVTSIVGVVVGWTLFTTGVGLVVLVFVGVFVAAGALYAARAIGGADVALLEWTGLPGIRRPQWSTRRRETGLPGVFAWARSLFGDPRYWLALGYCLGPQLALATVTFSVLVTWLSIAASFTTWPIWGWGVLGLQHAVNDGSGGTVRGLDWVLDRWLGGDQWVLEGVIYAVVGLIFLFLLPYVTRGLVWAHWWLARALLGAHTGDELREQLAGATHSRAAAVAAEDATIRRIERDIHDGPQQRLVRLQLDLASAGRTLDADPQAARELLDSAAQQAREALEELRAVSRGIAPPILADRGLVAALESAAGRSPVRVHVAAAIPAGLALAPELERGAYFIAHEALANAVKHAGATAIEMRVAVPEAGLLVVEVADDGRGGAHLMPGHGLEGLRDRADGLGGRLDLASGPGGTTVTAYLPLPPAAGAARPPRAG